MGVGAFNGVQFEVEDHERWVKWAQTYKRAYVNGASQNVVDTAGTDVFYNGGATVHGTGRDSSVVVSQAKTGAQIQALIGHQWNHVVYTFSAATKVTSIYWNGVLIFQDEPETL